MSDSTQNNPANAPVPPAPSPNPTINLTFEAESEVSEPLGRYKLLQKIGEGGCGVVHMAEQEEPVRRRVALQISSQTRPMFINPKSN